MELKRATPELLQASVMQQIIPSEILPDLLNRLSEGIIMNIIIIDNIPVGLIGLMDLHGNELMAVIHQNHRRKGLVFEGCIKTINEGFTELSLPYLQAKAIVNSPGHNLATKLGYKDVSINQVDKYVEVNLKLSRDNWQKKSIYK
jgi:hypothetical protein